MRDWTGSQIQLEALSVPCPLCLAKQHERCHAKGDPSHVLVAFPAHDVRVRAARKAEK